MNKTNTETTEHIFYDNLLSIVKKYRCYTTSIKNQYINLLSELTDCEEMSDDDFYNQIKKINSMGKIIIAYKLNRDIGDIVIIIGTGTIIIEPKLIHGCKNVAHIEDIVVKSEYRGKKISSNILNMLKDICKKHQCYKLILDCDEKVIPVYKSNGFEVKGTQMCIYF